MGDSREKREYNAKKIRDVYRFTPDIIEPFIKRYLNGEDFDLDKLKEIGLNPWIAMAIFKFIDTGDEEALMLE